MPHSHYGVLFTSLKTLHSTSINSEIFCLDDVNVKILKLFNSICAQYLLQQRCSGDTIHDKIVCHNNV